MTAFEITDQLGRLCLRVPFTLAQRSQANAGVGEVRYLAGLTQVSGQVTAKWVVPTREQTKAKELR